jgi:ADP-ribose pyrophosphatase
MTKEAGPARVTVFRGRKFSVEVGPVRYPDGQEHVQEIVRHPVSVVLLPLTDEGRIVLVHQFRPPIDRETWELPAGTVNHGEEADAAARRECEEETGLVPHRLERLTALYPSPGFCDEQMIFYRATDLRTPPKDSPHHADEDENITVKTVTREEAKAMVERGEIVDMKTAYGLTLL